MARPEGIEPPTFGLEIQYSILLSYGRPPVAGAADETRTRNPYLGRVMLYQLSYSRISWSERLDLNQRPHAPKACALPAAPRSDINVANYIIIPQARQVIGVPRFLSILFKKEWTCHRLNKMPDESY